MDLTQYCFDNEQPFTEWVFDRADNHFAILEDGKPIVQILDTRCDISIRGRTFPASLLSHVCVAPEHRGQRLMEKLMKYTLDQLKSEGVVLAQLYPMYHYYYAKYGFADCGEAVKIKMPLDELHHFFLTSLHLKRECAADVNPTLLLDIYKKATAEYSGYVVRTEKQMKQRLAEFAMDNASVVYTSGVDYAGYAIFHFERDTIKVDEFAADSDAARLEILTFLGSHFSTHSTCEIITSADDPLRRLFLKRKGRVTIEPWSMYRILDLAKFTGAMHCGDGDVMLEVVDDMGYCDSFWRFSGKNNSFAARKPREEHQPEGFISITELTRMLIGDKSDISRLDPRVREQLHSLFGRLPIWIYEMY
jgi:predicted acetyltransferase